MKLLAWLREVRWRVAAFLAFAAALNYADRAAISSVLPALRTEFTLTDTQLGLLGSAFLWAYALASPLAEHFGWRSGFCVLGGGGILLALFAPSFLRAPPQSCHPIG